MRQLRQLMPSENIIYFGDTARVPYGNRALATEARVAASPIFPDRVSAAARSTAGSTTPVTGGGIASPSDADP